MRRRERRQRNDRPGLGLAAPGPWAARAGAAQRRAGLGLEALAGGIAGAPTVYSCSEHARVLLREAPRPPRGL